jgi:hypothetical protein
MRRFGTIARAATIGVGIEFVLCAVSMAYVLSGGFGPCGPTRDVPGFVRVIHRPGFWLAGALAEDSSPGYLLVCLATTTVMLSVLAYTVLRVMRNGNAQSTFQ